MPRGSRAADGRTSEGRPRVTAPLRSLLTPLEGCQGASVSLVGPEGGPLAYQGQGPGSLVPDQAELDQPAQVQSGGAVVEPGVVLGEAAVADFAVAGGDEPGEWTVRPSASGTAEWVMDRLLDGCPGRWASRCWRRATGVSRKVTAVRLS